MSLCPRCGTALQTTAAVCTACCYVLEIPVTMKPPPLVAADTTHTAEVAQAPPAVRAPAPVQDPQPATAGLGNGLGIPTQRSAAFKPLRIATTPPPPNPYLAAERRLRAHYREARSQDGPARDSAG